jgi:uncharacterized protein (TIGR03435 family)
MRAETARSAQTATVSAAQGAETFEAVSIKPSQATASGDFGTRPGGRFIMEDGLLPALIARAYGVKTFQIAGAPDWVSQQRFTIQTTSIGNPTPGQVQGMLQRMLTDRFQLRVHADQRVGTVHVLTLARADGKVGPNLRPRTPPCEPGSRVPLSDLSPAVARSMEAGRETVPCGSTTTVGGTGMTGFGMTIPMLAQTIEDHWLNERVVDRTGLSGAFDIVIEHMSNQWTARGPSIDGAISDAPSLAEALKEQLGLRIEIRREPIDVLVIDRIERPAPD